jgi:secondary thiamine-phosphate synthase enzyme
MFADPSHKAHLTFPAGSIMYRIASAEGWAGTWDEWAAQEPKNAHSHLQSIILGNSESIPVVEGTLMLGKWQSVLMLDLDGPRHRTVALQFTGLSARQ